jgi:methionyl-tRNA formyltransferase
MKCISAGTTLFREWLPRLVDGTLTSEPQDASRASYFSLKDVPNGGLVSFGWTYPEIDRYVRGLSFHPIPNPFVHAASTHRGRTFYIQGVERLERGPGRARTHMRLGRITAVQIKDSTVALKGCWTTPNAVSRRTRSALWSHQARSWFVSV